VNELMSALRRIDGSSAGPAALGILLPPGRRTLLVLRPRSLPVDLLLLRDADATEFRDMSRVEGERTGRAFLDMLGEWLAGGPGSVEAVALDGGAGHVVRAVIGSLPFVACARAPGRPYQPEVLTDADSADILAARLAAALRPPPGRELEVYVNLRHFGSDAGNGRS
jgi:hypothetical protein